LENNKKKGSQPMDLLKKFCVPCEGQALPLAEEELESYLGHIDNWKLDTSNQFISKKFTFKNYQDALQCVLVISEIAEEENHHPDIQFGWGYCEVALTTHSICGLHPNDFIVAAKIDKAVQT
jgi:4a-hydroxytetrahydrobiopterin dehydratase